MWRLKTIFFLKKKNLRKSEQLYGYISEDTETSNRENLFSGKKEYHITVKKYDGNYLITAHYGQKGLFLSAPKTRLALT